MDSLNGVFQGYAILYCEEGEPFAEQYVPPQNKERYEAEIKNLKGVTKYIIRVSVFTLSCAGLPSSPITAFSGESGK